MIDTISIGKQALQLVTREGLVTTEGEVINPASPQRQAINTFMTQAILTVLEQYDWTFATTRKKLIASKIYTKDADKLRDDADLYTDEYLGWQMMFRLPETFLGHLEIYEQSWQETIDTNAYDKSPLWWINGNELYIATTSIQRERALNIQYVHCDIKKIKLPASVELCMVYYLAHLISPVLLGRYSTTEMFLNMYRMRLIDAKSEDSMRRPHSGKIVVGTVQTF